MLLFRAVCRVNTTSVAVDYAADRLWPEEIIEVLSMKTVVLAHARSEEMLGRLWARAPVAARPSLLFTRSLVVLELGLLYLNPSQHHHT